MINVFKIYRGQVKKKKFVNLGPEDEYVGKGEERLEQDEKIKQRTFFRFNRFFDVTFDSTLDEMLMRVLSPKYLRIKVLSGLHRT